MNFPNVWKTSTTTPQTATASASAAPQAHLQLQLQAQNIPLFGVVRTMTPRRRPDPLNMPRRPSSELNPPNDDDGHQIPLPYTGPGNCTSYPRGPSPPSSSSSSSALSPSTSPVTAFLDATFRTYTERIHAELTGLRGACARVLGREHAEAERWKAHCVAVRRERDVARERVRVLLGEREREREGWYVAHGDSDAVRAGARQSLRETRRSRSHGPLGLGPAVHGRQPQASVKGSRSASPPTVNARMKTSRALLGAPAPAASRRSSLQSSRSTSPAPSSSATAFSDPGHDPALYELAYPSPKLTPLDGDAAHPLFLPSRVGMCISPTADSPPLKRSQSAGPVLGPSSTSNARPLFLPSSSAFASAERKRQRPASTGGIPDAASLAPAQPSWVPTRDALLERIPATRTATLQLEHVDLMYRAVDGMLECRACRLAHDKLTSGESESGCATVTAVPADAGWDELLDHCLMKHPAESRDVAGLHPAQIRELRRRLGEKDMLCVRVREAA
ncbi:hypothetical protein LshimejAT787_0100630 [Lyophyllum shimeji]|uniref:Uncharacterized protein n=1 Tax=Lyophyllum shimeji TaxID=47721 RepID=A0A9P3PCI7_LYOSH|nr:hypothetical protein LshimejAT787_0100630 [Lyophyllum shimeji]